jgi:hypothetical protein
MFALTISGVAKCDTIVTLGNTWAQGQDATFRLAIPSTTSTWSAQVTFDKPVTALNVYNAVVTPCSGVNFINILRAAFTLVDPKSVKN